jgi:hypothetical protein
MSGTVPAHSAIGARQCAATLADTRPQAQQRRVAVPGARHLTVVLFAAIWIVAACSGGAPAGQTAPTVALVPGSSTAPTVAPTVASSIVQPSQAPAATPTTPSSQPKPTTSQPRPNLVISDFFVEEDPVVVGGQATLVATVTNSGSADAGRFNVEIVMSEANRPDVVLEAATYSSGLAMGQSSELTVTINPDVVAELRLIARADVTDEVTEQDESDNESVLEITVESLGNLTLPADTFSAIPHPDAPGTYLFYFTLANTGTSAIDDRVSVKFFAYTSAGQYIEWGTHDIDVSLAADERQSLVVAFSVAPGTYRAYALGDAEDTLEEGDEGDNQAFFDFTAP